jgi:hypothetical protein
LIKEQLIATDKESTTEYSYYNIVNNTRLGN